MADPGYTEKTGLLLIPILRITNTVLIAQNNSTAFEILYLLPVMNTMFLGIIPTIIGYLALKVFVISGSVSIS